MTDFPPTPEQSEALRLFATGRSLAIEAGAGAGKTSTLTLLAESTPRRGQYVAFNKAIVEEAKLKFPRSVACNTAHSLAYRNVVGPNKWIGERLRSSRRMKSIELANALGLRDEIKVEVQDGNIKRLSRSYLAGLAMRGVTRFCQSADPEPNASHVPYVDGIDVPPGRRENNRVVAKALEPAMRKAWADLNSREGVLPFKHDHYLKMWQLSGPKINAEFILFDEAQDANPVLVDIVKQQTHAQLVWVGDSQQQIYTFTGAVNALQQVGAEQQAFLSQSFRFGPAIADVANQCLSALDAELTLTGFEPIPSRVEPLAEPGTILCRTNATAVRNVLDAIGQGRRPYLVGGGREVRDFAKAAQKLMAGEWTDHPELACFDSWGEVVSYVEQDEQGGDLRLLVNLIDEFGVQVILDALEGMDAKGAEQAADVVVSTAHKAKGREWDTVQLADDFPAEPTGEELRLLYVAVTRAKLVLDASSSTFLTGGASAPADPSEAASGPEDAPEAPSAPVAPSPSARLDEIDARLAEIRRETMQLEHEATVLREQIEDNAAAHEAERRMHEMEAEADRAGTVRDETAKHAARAAMEGRI
jgi:hypothetical protein